MLVITKHSSLSKEELVLSQNLDDWILLSIEEENKLECLSLASFLCLSNIWKQDQEPPLE